MQSWEYGGGFEIVPLDVSSGFLLFRASGVGAIQAFKNESGGHRWQRIPPNERHGRVHTSTVTVAVLREPSELEVRINHSDLDIKTTRGSGPGGQNRNKIESCVVVTHKPSGIVVRCDTERSQGQNKASALGILRARILERQEQAAASAENNSRRSQVGSGMRGDKTWTIRSQDGIVTYHPTGQKFQLRDYLRGDFGA
jgi:peptide chain release factor 1